MSRAVILETTFLIDLEREQSRGRAGGAIDWLEAHDDARLYLTFTILGELAAGVSLSDRERWNAFVAPFFVLASNNDVSWHYGRTFQHLQQNRQRPRSGSRRLLRAKFKDLENPSSKPSAIHRQVSCLLPTSHIELT